MRLSSKRALVTGAASGIGKAVVSAFLNEGAEVLGTDLTFAAMPPATSNALTTLPLDISKEDDWQQLLAKMTPLDIVVACAGVSDAKPIAATSLDDWRRILQVNLDGAFLTVKYGKMGMQGTRGEIDRAGWFSVRDQGGCGGKCLLCQQSRVTNVGAGSSVGIQARKGASELRFSRRSRYPYVAEKCPFGEASSNSTEANKGRGMP